MEWRQDEFVVSDDPALVSVDAVHRFLSQESTWSKGIPRERVATSIANSMCFTLLHNGKQIGFARLISDRSTIAYLGDVYVETEWRGKGLSKWLMDCVMSHPELQGLRRWILVTGDAHGLYRKYGFTQLVAPDRYMEKHDPAVYQR
jgi:N-acetylglutamate synthase-like GNAT family acetyltransferase